MISLKQLTYALAVEQTLHFKKASELCNVSQSALSTAITELEKQLDLQIFERNNKKVIITAEGLLVLNKAKQIKIEIDELYQLSQINKSALTSPMTMGLIPTIGPYLLPKVLPEVRQQYPNFKLSIVEEQSHNLIDMVRNGDIDVAVLALPFPIDGLMAFEFWQEDFYWVSHKDECPSQMKEITSDELELEKLMLLKEGHCLKDHALAACSLPINSSSNSNKGNKGNASFNSTSLHTLIQMVAGKLGTTLVPQMALDQLIHTESELTAVHLNEPGPHRRLAFVVRPNYVKTKDIELLKQIFTNQLEQHCG
ncbi:transcriptional regulator [Psychrosphaera saromensis]|uniref:LysR family transcriptional regulator n=1 Tax=Psychrosphaera saromensis TaxID=716813 RepID=A0A2S7UYA2_9GAMM|nr:hydrogen peroxide-inducible genes activator [Psychrosphaera saromensis]PQJ54913.1 LysR family transcriptional regulator [Psychrosphaera saromensis]GHB56165.1 transcriptional regulator [Psychrosphaera saromensis]GLQ13842.1 transcriptional regulator [Psychrosphaera saromensis]